MPLQARRKPSTNYLPFSVCRLQRVGLMLYQRVTREKIEEYLLIRGQGIQMCDDEKVRLAYRCSDAVCADHTPSWQKNKWSPRERTRRLRPMLKTFV